MLAAFIVKAVEEELILRSIPEGCNIVILGPRNYSQTGKDCFGIVRILKK